ncbi:MAG: protein kinase [Nanoarchaeota archaeon]|nr:protein kinase [Nanoarchaeota archaeon]
MELVHILGADAVNPYTRDNCIDKRELWEHYGGRIYFVSPDPMYLDRVIADITTPSYADKVFPLGSLEYATSVQTDSLLDLICPINYTKENGLLKIAADHGEFPFEIVLESETKQLLNGALREKDVLKAVQGSRHVIPYQDHCFVLTPDTNKDVLSFVLRMDYLQGRNLQQLLHYNYAFTVQDIAKILADVAAAVYDIQQKKVVHQDIKPGNIMYHKHSSSELGNATLIDFGVSCFHDQPSPFREGVIAGTPVYMSPEQAEGRIIPETDVFALGILAYNLFTGNKPNFADSGLYRTVNNFYHLMTLIKYGGRHGNEQWGYDQRNVIMDNLRQLSEQRFNQRLPMSLLEAIEAAFEPNPRKREQALVPLGNEALKLATGEIHTEELPNILIEREIDAPISQRSDNIALRLLEQLEQGTTDIITVPDDTVRIPELIY